MSPRGLALLAGAALLAIVGGVYLATPHATHDPVEGSPLLPGLERQLNAVTSVTLRKSSKTPTLTLHKMGTIWTVADRADFPADTLKLRKLLLALRDAKIVEQKTSDPARFAAIGVEDPGAPGATSTQITVLSPQAQQSVIIGKPVGSGDFVRLADGTRTYSVEPAISFETEPRYWIDTRLLDVPTTKIQRLEVVPATGLPYSLHRASAPDATFGLDGVPSGRKSLDPQALEPSPTLLSNFAADDVAPAADIDFSHPSTAVVTLADGSVITFTGTLAADKHWIRVQSSSDATLSAKTAGRAFEVPGYRYDALFRPLEQLLVPKSAPKSAKEPRGK